MGERIGDLQQIGARHQIFADALLQRDEEIAHAVELVLQRPPVRSRAYGRCPRTASARSWPMCALMPASANCRGRTPGWRRNWNSGRQQAGGRRSVGRGVRPRPR